MDWYLIFLHGVHGNLLFEHMECKKLILSKLFAHVQGSSVLSVSDAFYIDLLIKRIYI